MKHNSYFEGKVQSLGSKFPDGNATVGVMEPGKYTFSTNTEERMTVIAGSMKAKLPGEGWHEYGMDGTFVVPANVSFEVEASASAAYICYYK
jgi:uncharacterized protein YaiE (UPF0345 family)